MSLLDERMEIAAWFVAMRNLFFCYVSARRADACGGYDLAYTRVLLLAETDVFFAGRLSVNTM